MKLCVVGKYPPIEGGVSTSTYWLARGLAARGHEIHVVTNADEVEEEYRLRLGPEDWDYYQPQFPTSGGRVEVHNVEAFGRHRMHHIPRANPFVSRIAGLATDIVRGYGCEVILAFYCEPYAVAGWMASQWTGRPLVVKHAGSDLERLFRVPNLARTYKEILRSADGVITRESLKRRFIGMGVRPDRLETDVPFSVPTQVFHPAVEPLDPDRLAIALREEHLDATEKGQPSVDWDIPSIGVYGKVGVSKGTFDLISALGRVRREGREFRLLAMIGRTQGERLIAALEEAGIRDLTKFLPFLPHWRVPSFIRSCTAVCFLERDFPVAIHGPIVPREVMACGTCLVLSGEIAEKNRSRDAFAPEENIVIVQDPKNRDDLAAKLDWVLSDVERAKAVGERGLEISRKTEDFERFVVGWEELLGRHLERGLANRAATAPPTPEEALSLIVPELVSYIRRAHGDIVRSFIRQSAIGEPFDVAIGFCEFAADELKRTGSGDGLPQLLAALRYVKERLVSAYESVHDSRPAFMASDRLLGEAVTEEACWSLRPLRGNSVRVEQFDYDLCALFTKAPWPLGQAEDGSPGVLDTLPKQSVSVLFQRSANLAQHEFQINEAACELVSLCDGTRATSDVVEAMSLFFGVEASDHRLEVKRHVLAALAKFYRNGVIVFAEWRPEWGWTGGIRGATDDPASNNK